MLIFICFSSCLVEYCCEGVQFGNSSCTLLKAVSLSLGGVVYQTQAAYQIWVSDYIWQKISGNYSMGICLQL